MLRIEAVPVGGGQSFLIADGTGARGPGGKLHVDDYGMTFDAVVDRVKYLDGAITANIANAERAYKQTASCPLSVQYEFDTEAKCFLFSMDLQTAVPVLADIYISAGGTLRILPNVLLRPLSFKSIGMVAVQVNYPINFGMVTQPLIT